MNSTTGDAEKYFVSIQTNFVKIKDLRQQIEIAKCSSEYDAAYRDERNRLEELFKSSAVSFDEFYDVVVRRLVECIRVMADKRISVLMKGGLQREKDLRVAQ